jgi:heme-degrading monooxygenase HmoA
MILTILEAQVAPEKAAVLEETYNQAARQLDPGIAQTLLVHSLQEPKLWKILTIWESREALDAMRQTGVTPRGILIFRAAGAEPVFSMLSVISHAPA